MQRVLSLLIILLISAPINLLGEDISVGCMFGLTGDSAAFGKGELDAVTLATEEWNAKGGINGKKITLEVEDTATTQAKIVSAYKKLTEVSGHKFIMGPTWLETYQAIIPLAEKKHVLLITPSAEGHAIKHADPKSPWALSTYYSSEEEISRLLGALKQQGAKKIVGLYTEEPFFLLVRQMVEEQAKRLGLEVVYSDNQAFGFTGFRNLLPKIKQLQPDAILAMQSAEGSVLDLLQARAEQMPNVTIVGIHDFAGFVNKAEFKRYLDKIIFSKFVLADPSFAIRFKQRFGYEPILTHSNAYDTANMVFTALANGKDDGASMREFLLNSELKTVTFGAVRFTPSGMINTSKVQIQKISAGTESVLSAVAQ
ncbi:MAG: ABC transporter substrate-binding protein [Oligoflexia bacterium]|nr:ABC transporter substrate-binding protein [Oligoflexia bacterium]